MAQIRVTNEIPAGLNHDCIYLSSAVRDRDRTRSLARLKVHDPPLD
jgi:hypothetical protein